MLLYRYYLLFTFEGVFGDVAAFVVYLDLPTVVVILLAAEDRDTAEGLVVAILQFQALKHLITLHRRVCGFRTIHLILLAENRYYAVFVIFTSS